MGVFVFIFISRKLQNVINVRGLKLRTDITKAVQFVLLAVAVTLGHMPATRG